jgi:SeqA protein.
MKPLFPPLNPVVFREICACAAEHLLPPDDVVRIAAGRWSREPFLIQRDQISESSQEKKRFLSILSALYNGRSRSFDDAASTVRGGVRTYFGRTATDISSTGSSN